MNLKAALERSIRHPHGMWNTQITQRLISAFLATKASRTILCREQYSTAKFHFNDIESNENRYCIMHSDYGCINLEDRSPSLEGFYQENGLVLRDIRSLDLSDVVNKLQYALEMIRAVSNTFTEVACLVWAIHLLQSDNPCEDISYSHPNLPFSIFLSTCSEADPVSSLRVAESIIHEAMHLKLSLAEKVVPLVAPGDAEHFSPWRDELREAGGLLHGAFVFKSLYFFFSAIQWGDFSRELIEHVRIRKAEIADQMASITISKLSPSLTPAGNALLDQLVKLQGCEKIANNPWASK